MKRDPRLRDLSSEHHQALVIAKTLRLAAEAGEKFEGLTTRFRNELEPHFEVEEQWVLPGLEAVGAQDLATQTLDDHNFLRTTVQAAHDGDRETMIAFAARLHEHVRFEERTLFPACEKLLSDDVLDAIPKGPYNRA